MFRDFPAHENLRETFGLESSSEYIVKQQLGLGVPKPRQQLTETTNAISTFATSARFITCIFMAAMLLTDIWNGKSYQNIFSFMPNVRSFTIHDNPGMGSVSAL